MSTKTTTSTTSTTSTSWRRRLLWIDAGGGAVVGVVMLALAGWLAELYHVPRSLLLGMAAANLLYAAYSGSLARRVRRPLALLGVLAGANVAWGVVCLGLAITWRDTASPFALVHFVVEAVYVGGLGALEWRWRELLQNA